jgi:hypothetical protein
MFFSGDFPSRTGALSGLWAFVSLLAIATAHASDNSKSTLDLMQLLENWASQNPTATLEVFDQLKKYGSSPISYTPPPPVVIKPPSLQALQQSLAADQQILANQQTALTQAQSELAFWQGQAGAEAAAEQNDPNLGTPASDINVPLWTQAVESDQKLVATVEGQISKLLAQIAAAGG